MVERMSFSWTTEIAVQLEKIWRAESHGIIKCQITEEPKYIVAKVGGGEAFDKYYQLITLLASARVSLLFSI